MAADPTATQSDVITSFRSNCGIVLQAITAVSGDRLKAASLGGFDAFATGAYAGSNADLVSADIDAAMNALLSLRALLYDTSGNPTPALLAIVKVAR
jgi:hypothetical protein